MLRITAWLAIALFFFLNSSAQRPYYRGYLLLDNTMDTLWGYISFYNREPGHVSYKSLPDEKAEDYLAADVTGFRIVEDSFTYISAKVPVNKYRVETQTKVWRTQDYIDVFLKPMALGPKMCLYKLFGTFPAYYIEKDRKFYEMNITLISQYQVADEARDYIARDPYEITVYGYRTTLLSLVGSTRAIRDRILQMPLTEEALKDLVEWYNGGNVTVINKEYKRQKMTTFFVGITSLWQSVNVMKRTWFLPELKGRWQLLPALQVGLRLRGDDSAGPVSGTLSAGISTFQNSFTGRRDSFPSVSFTSKGQFFFARGTADGRLGDLKHGSFSAGIFAAYYSSWVETGVLTIRFPATGDYHHEAMRQRLEGLTLGLHAQATIRHWELGAFVQAYNSAAGDWIDGWYVARCNFSGFSLYYHF